MHQTFPVTGMACSACSANVERRLNALEGVSSATVNLVSRIATVDYDPAVITPEKMKEAVSDIGYDMVVEADRNVEAIERRAYTTLRRKVLLSWLFALLVMGIGMGFFAGDGLTTDTRNQCCLIIALRN